MRRVGVYEAKTHLAELLKKVECGESITITRHGEPVAVLAPVEEARRKKALEAIESWIAYRKAHNITLGPDLTIRQLRDEGKR